MIGFWRELRFVLRSLRRRPGYSSVVIGTLALAIGANTAIFSVAYGILLQPLPYPDAERLVMVRASFSGTQPSASIAGPMLAELRAQATTIDRFEGLWTSTASLQGEGEPEKVRLAWVTAGFLPLLGGDPGSGGRGRHFSGNELEPSGPQTALLSHELFVRRFAGDPAALGTTLSLDGGDWTALGVVPEGFRLLLPAGTVGTEVDLWVPLPVMAGRSLEDQNREQLYLKVIGRLAPSATAARAAEEMHAIGRRLQEQYQEYAGTELDLHVSPLHADLVAGVRPGIVALMGAVVFVLLIACANVANLALARSTSRQREMALRFALGCGRGRLAAAALLENLLLGLAGGGVGLVLAWWVLDLLVGLEPPGLPRLENVALDVTVLAFTFGIAVFAALLISSLPAARTRPEDLHDVLKQSSGIVGASRSQLYLRRGLVVCEVALSVVLLVGASLMMQSFVRLQRTDPGFDAESVLTFTLNLPGSRYSFPDADGERRGAAAFHTELQRRLAGLPGVVAAGAISHLPLGGRSFTAEYWRDPESDGPQARASVQERSVTPGYFRAMGIRLLAGRVFDGSETPDDDLVVIDRKLATTMWPGADAVGQRLKVSLGTQEQWLEVVGVVDHVRHDELTRESAEQLYVPFPRWTFSEMSVVVRTSVAPEDLVRQVRAEVRHLDAALPLYDVRPMSDYMSDAAAELRYPFLLMGVFSALALVLAAVGIYGTLSYLVGLRTREIGLRMAMGAHARDIRRLVTLQALVPSLVGIAVGVLGALALTRVLESLLYEVEATDPFTFGGIAATMLGVAALACWLPSQRATRVSPSIVLRE
jgi:predicted permease